MIQVIVTGHGNFASGMLSALKLIAGESEHIHGIDFLESFSTEDLKEKIQEMIESVNGEIVIAADLVGGSPYNVAVTLMTEFTDKEIKVIAGVNFPTILSSVFADRDVPLDVFVKNIMDEGMSAFSEFKPVSMKMCEEEEDGI